MESYRVPAGEASAQLVEKKSRFIGNIFKVETPEQAQEIIKATQKRLWDASHNVYAYVLKNGVMRFSDDGEPQGTAGMPTLDVLKKEQVFDVLCVTTRYFGGTLLGAGGLVRAYSAACKLALDAAGIAVMTPYALARICCPYPLFELVRKQLEQFSASETGVIYTEAVTLEIALPQEKADSLNARIVEVTSGQVGVEVVGKKMFAERLI